MTVPLGEVLRCTHSANTGSVTTPLTVVVAGDAWINSGFFHLAVDGELGLAGTFACLFGNGENRMTDLLLCTARGAWVGSTHHAEEGGGVHGVTPCWEWVQCTTYLVFQQW